MVGVLHDNDRTRYKGCDSKAISRTWRQIRLLTPVRWRADVYDIGPPSGQRRMMSICLVWVMTGRSRCCVWWRSHLAGTMGAAMPGFRPPRRNPCCTFTPDPGSTSRGMAGQINPPEKGVPQTAALFVLALLSCKQPDCKANPDCEVIWRKLALMSNWFRSQHFMDKRNFSMDTSSGRNVWDGGLFTLAYI